MNPTGPNLPLKLVLPILFVFACVSALSLHYHELFLDEAHHFLVSRDSSSLADLYSNLRYDGHPRLWGALLFVLTHYVSASPVAMQVLHLLLAVAAAFALLRYGPFPLWVKILILSGYYFLFEYNWLSRNYVLGILLLFICCQLLRDPKKNLIRIGVLLVLLCCTHMFYTFASIGIFFYLVIWFLQQGGGVGRGRFGVLSLFFLAGLGLALIQARTPPRSENVNLTPVLTEEWLSMKNVSFAVYGVIRGWLPVPQVNGAHFWNSYWLSPRNISGMFAGTLFVLFLVFPALFLWKKAGPLVFYYTGAGLLFVFFVVTQMTASRYFGMVYIYFLAAAWMGADDSGPVFSLAAIPWNRRAGRLLQVVLAGVLAIHVVVGVYALEQDIRWPFSQARNTADYLRTLQPSGRVVVVDGYNSGPQLCAYLGGRVFYLTTGAEGSFCVWRRAYFPTPRPSIDEEVERNPGLRRLGEFILVSNRRLGADSIRPAGGYRLTALRYFENSITGENYFVYQADPL